MINYKNTKGMKTYLVIIFLLGILGNVSAQQDPMFTQYMHNPVTINPAYAGSRGTLNFTAMNRQQWVGIDGAPRTMTFSVNSPFNGYKVGIGFSLIYEEIGPSKQTGIYADYSYHLKLNQKIKLAFGLKGGVNVYDINKSNLRGTQGDDFEMSRAFQKLYLPNVGVGSYLYSDRFYVGLSIPKLLQNSLSDNANTLNALNKEERHYFLTGGLVVDLSENVRFKSSSTIRIVNGSPVSVELSGAFLLHDKLWLGGMYRLGDSVGALVKFDITSQLSLGYAFDMTQSRLRVDSQGTHEVYVSYDFAFRNNKILSPRFF